MALNYIELKNLVKQVGRANGEKRKRLVEKLIRELLKLDPFEGVDEFTIWLAKLLARVKWLKIDTLI